MKKDSGQKRKGSRIFPLLIILCLAVMGVSIYKLVSISMEYRQGEREYDILQSYTTELGDTGDSADDDAGENAAGGGTSEGDASSGAGDQTDSCPIAVDFESLKNINPDLICWLYIPVLDLSYPVVQGEDNDWYLHRTFEGTANFAGSIFADAAVEHPLEDPNTIIYGHSMKNQTMFGKLKLLLQDNLYAENPVFWILTEEGETEYQIADISYTEAGSSVYTLFEEADDEFVSFLEDIVSSSAVQNENLPELSSSARLVTLSTCAASEGTARLVVRGIAVTE